uniref:Uncharacterized protein n=1 Tax=viral metagenome TaxID=1070528 RepID=A0A6C0IV62_9ZZZZ
MTSRLISPELSLLRHREKFFALTEEERRVRNEHKKFLAVFLDQCVSNGFTQAIYTVPPMIPGPFASYDVHEMTLYLAKYCRSAGYTVAFYGPESPTTLRISGWESGDWMDKNRPPPTEVSMKRPALAKKTPTTKVTPEEASILAQQGALTRRLRAQVDKL